MRVSIIGAGYVGLSTGLVLASFGNEVYFVDVNKEKIKKLKKEITSFPITTHWRIIGKG